MEKTFEKLFSFEINVDHIPTLNSAFGFCEKKKLLIKNITLYFYKMDKSIQQINEDGTIDAKILYRNKYGKIDKKDSQLQDSKERFEKDLMLYIDSSKNMLTLHRLIKEYAISTNSSRGYYIDSSKNMHTTTTTVDKIRIIKKWQRFQKGKAKIPKRKGINSKTNFQSNKLLKLKFWNSQYDKLL